MGEKLIELMRFDFIQTLNLCVSWSFE